MKEISDPLGLALFIVLAVLVSIGFGSLLLPLLTKRRKWDFFFSYKSENANEVRRIAERVMAAGYRVWFAEYEVLLKSYEKFEPLIRRGAKRCDFAILFTTEKFARSQHCATEVIWLKEHFAAEPHKIIEVCLEQNEVRKAFALSSQCPQVYAHLPTMVSDRNVSTFLRHKFIGN